MKYGEPFAVDVSDADFYSNTENQNNEYSFSRTNIWNNTFDTPEINCDFAILHQDLQEIKSLIADIRNIISEFFVEK